MKKTRNRWTEKQKIQLITTYLATGSLRLASAMCHIPENTVRHWHMTDWWKSLESEIKYSENAEVSTRLKKIVDKSIDAVIDRLEQGDPMFNPRTGEIIRVPVKAETAVKALNSAVDKRQILNNAPTKIVEQRSIDERLSNLMAKFEQMATGRLIEQQRELIEDAKEDS